MIAQSLIFAMLVQFGGLSGQVRDARTQGAIRMASVELWNSQMPIDHQYTDSDGGFRFAVLGTGRFTIAVNCPEYETSYVQIDSQMAASHITIELVPKKSSATNLRPSISVREFLVPKSARERFDLARKEVRAGNCAKAIEHFQQGLRLFDEDASAHNDLGNCYREVGDLDNAEESFNRARALSDSVYIRLNLAEVYTFQKRFEEAEMILLEAVRKAPNAGDAYYGLMLVYFQQNLLEKAVAAGLQAHDDPHQIADVHLVLAEIYLRQNKSSDALQQLQMYLKEAPNGALSERVRQLVKSGRLDNPRVD